MTNLALRTNTPRSPDNAAGLQTAAPTPVEIAVLNTAPAGWWRARQGVRKTSGWRWEAFNRQIYANAYSFDGPVTVTAGDGKPSLQMGYGNPHYVSTNQGSVLTPSEVPMLAVDGWYAANLVRVATVASGECPSPGGYVWRSLRGPGDNTNPSLLISNVSGRPAVTGGGRTIGAPLHAGAPFDLRDDTLHLIETAYDGAGDKLYMSVDGNWSVSSATGATSDLDDVTYPDIKSVMLGAYLRSDGLYSSPLQGHRREDLFYSRYCAMGGAESAAIRALVVAQYGVVLT